MLIEFAVANFRSFRERQALSMAAGNFSEHTDANTFHPGLEGFPRLVRSAALYGPNAAGKTNLLRGLQFLQFMILNSARATGDSVSNYSPFKLDAKSSYQASEFKITFAQNGTRYEYGAFIGPNIIHKEWLMEFARPRGRLLFHRLYNDQSREYVWKFSSFLKGTRELWKEATRPNALFLSTATQLNSRQLLPVFEWFQKRLVVIVDLAAMNASLTLNLLRDIKGKERLLPFLREADPGIADVVAQRETVPLGGGLVIASQGSHILEHMPGNETPNLWKITLSHKGTNNDQLFGSPLNEESAGTQFLFQSAGAWLNVLANGEVLCFDEIDRSLHPLLVAFFLAQFHSNKTNPQNAQIIFSTHNTWLINPKAKLLRRDQIWFVEKDNNNASTLYPLTDFHPRNDSAIEDAYLRGRYGALPILRDLTD